ncbi:MAG: hypothetical protein WB643_02415 [Candidatus Bathyarchaeia archaeon]
MTDEEDIFVSRIVRSANRKNEEIFQRILEAAEDDKPTDECWAETHREFKLSRNPVLERLTTQTQPSQARQEESSDSARVKISHHETDQAVVWQIEVDREGARVLDDVFDGFAAFLKRLLTTA